MKKLLLLTTALCSFALTLTAQKPDVVVILTDQWSPRYTSWDNPRVKTPYLDQIAKEGMIFDACYTTSPVCMPEQLPLQLRSSQVNFAEGYKSKVKRVREEEPPANHPSDSYSYDANLT